MKKEKKKKNRYLLFQLGTAILVLFGVAIILNARAILIGNVELKLNNMYEMSKNLGDNISDNLLAYEALPWYMDYLEEYGWNEAEGNQGLTVEDAIALAMLNKKYKTAALIPQKKIDKLSNGQKTELALNFYNMLTDTCFNMQNVGERIEIKVSRKTDDGKEFLFFKGDSDNETVNSRNVYGSEFDETSTDELLRDSLVSIKYKKYPEDSKWSKVNSHDYYFEGMKGEKPEGEFDLEAGDLKSGIYLNQYTYVPVIKDGDIICIVTVKKGWTRDEFWDMFFSGARMELLNVIYLFGCAVVLLILVNFIAVKPVSNVQKNVRKYTADKDSASVVAGLANIRYRNEVGRLADDISKMAVEMDNYSRELIAVTSDKERMKAELDVASGIQAGILPRVNSDEPAFQDRDDFEVFASMKTAREVGGDLYDCFLIDDDHLALVVGDVSGKGIPAALFMAYTMTLIRHELHSAEKSIGEVLYTVNNYLCEGNEELMFVTVWTGVLELSTGKLVCANGGHDYPVMYREGRDFAQEEEDNSLPLGVMKDTEYTESICQLNPGDVIFQYTDGIPEAMNVDECQFGEERMLEVLNQSKGSSTRELYDAIVRAVEDFVGEAPQSDDMTVLCVRYYGSQIRRKDNGDINRSIG